MSPKSEKIYSSGREKVRAILAGDVGEDSRPAPCSIPAIPPQGTPEWDEWYQAMMARMSDKPCPYCHPWGRVWHERDYECPNK